MLGVIGVRKRNLVNGFSVDVFFEVLGGVCVDRGVVVGVGWLLLCLGFV